MAVPDANTFYGLLINLGNSSDRINVAGQLGTRLFRVNTFVSAIISKTQNLAIALRNAGNLVSVVEQWIEVLPPNLPQPFPTDLALYADELNINLDEFSPDLVVIENEESNDLHHTGTPQQYIDELSTAIGICHGRGLKVTNGGLTSYDLIYLYAQNLVDTGKIHEYNNLKATYGIDISTPAAQAKLDFVTPLVAAYKILDLDYVNFHWYEIPKAVTRFSRFSGYTNLIRRVCNYLAMATEKPLVTNEIGVFENGSTYFCNLLNDIGSLAMDYVIFNPGDSDAETEAMPFYYSDLTLTNLGIILQNYLLTHGQRPI